MGRHDSDELSAPPPAATLARRRVLMAAGSITSAGVVTLSSPAASAAPGSTMTVWKLQADWGSRRGPHAKTRLHSSASRRAARHRYALTRADGEAMNLHKCSFAPAIAVIVDADSFSTLWDALSYPWSNPTTGRTVRMLDDRHVDRLSGGSEILAEALSPAAGAAPGSPAGAPGDGGRATAGSGATSGNESQGLALTGSETPGLVALGIGALAAGVATLRSRRVR